MKNYSTDFNRLKSLMFAIIKSAAEPNNDPYSIDDQKDRVAWCTDWDDDLDETFYADMKKIQKCILLYEAAISENDRLTAKAALADALVACHCLTSFFDALRLDLKKILVEKSLNWPSFPENFAIPSKYEKFK